MLYLTFLEFDTQGNFILVIQGKYAEWGSRKVSGLIEDIKLWKSKPDPWGRNKHVFVSIGGATFQPGNTINGNPQNIVPGSSNYPNGEQLFQGFNKFLTQYGGIFDGIDLDLENSSRILMKNKSSIWINFCQKIKSGGLLLSAAPEADNSSIQDYLFLIPYLDFFMPQFYNNGPNQLYNSYGIGNWDLFPADTNWMTQRGAWQTENSHNVKAWWFVCYKLYQYINKKNLLLGPLVPSSMGAADGFNCWDYAKFVNTVIDGEVDILGCWCIEQDVAGGKMFEKAVLKAFN